MDNGESTELGNFNNFDTKGFATPNGHFTFNDCAVLCNFLAAECSSFEYALRSHRSRAKWIAPSGRMPYSPTPST